MREGRVRPVHNPQGRSMLDDLPPDLPRLHTLRTWHAMCVQRIDAKIAALTERQAQQERVQRARREREPEWVVELGIGDGRPPAEVHAGHCYAIGKRRRPVSRDEARRLLAEGLRACSHCTPDTTLDIPLSRRTAPTTAAHPPATHPWRPPPLARAATTHRPPRTGRPACPPLPRPRSANRTPPPSPSPAAT
ncbi:DUF6233 domain-containing protein [Streptomyces liliiviolaceus]|uniref:DUF6233 domain-containing protein n=1 Tax=Streptomyces liliiviolaceus TaxID=2823109 RepID=UPI0027E35857|nr:DUF6233 domain-containing protein [Streptomyces liliiviolaceus]